MGSSLGNLQGGPLGMWTPGGQKGLDYKTVDLDPRTSQMINDMATRAQAPESEIAGRYTAGVNEAAKTGIMSPEQVQQEAARGGGNNTAQMNAIRNKYNQSSQQNIQSLTQKVQLGAPQIKSQQMMQAFSMVQAKQNVAMHNYENLMGAFNQSQMARAQVLSSVLSLGGTVGGMAAGGAFSGGGSQRAPGNAMAGGYGDAMSRGGYNPMGNGIESMGSEYA